MTESTPEELRERYTGKLEAERTALQDASVETRADRKPVELDQQSVGRLSRMDAMQGQAMAAAVEARRKGRSVAINAALVRLQGEDFGWCEDCGEFIGLPRLDLDAALQRCASCAR